MTDRLPVPPELYHLIEKREAEDRRQSARRSNEDRRESDLGPGGRMESAEDLDQLPSTDQRSGTQRREDGKRRTEVRRQADADPSDSVTSEPQPLSTDAKP